MEQARYWMWSKPTQSFFGDSWEEQAFAVDAAAGSLGGCVWPPRSYTCSFCRREFRSAQALGGHMNVHRRDRARLKQSQDPLDHEQVPLQKDHLPNHSSPLDLQYPHQFCNPNPNLGSSQFRVIEKSSFPLFSSSMVEGLQKSSSIFPIPSRSNSVTQTNFLHVSDENKEEKSEKSLGFEDSIAKEDYLKTDLSISLNLAIHRKRSNSCEGERRENIYCKKQKVGSTSLSSFSKSNSSSDRFDVQSEVLELSSTSIEELDLELNLGMSLKKIK